jgi:hypothetical protein
MAKVSSFAFVAFVAFPLTNGRNWRIFALEFAGLVKSLKKFPIPIFNILNEFHDTRGNRPHNLLLSFTHHALLFFYLLLCTLHSVLFSVVSPPPLQTTVVLLGTHHSLLLLVFYSALCTLHSELSFLFICSKTSLSDSNSLPFFKCLQSDKLV